MPVTYCFSIDWTQTSLSALKNQESPFLYALVDPAGRLLYISKRYDEKPPRRLFNNHSLIGRIQKFIPAPSIWLGHIRTKQPLVSKRMVEDVEALLIYLNQPILNQKFISSYTRRDNLLIKSYNCPAYFPLSRLPTASLAPLIRYPLRTKTAVTDPTTANNGFTDRSLGSARFSGQGQIADQLGPGHPAQKRLGLFQIGEAFLNVYRREGSQQKAVYFEPHLL